MLITGMCLKDKSNGGTDKEAIVYVSSCSVRGSNCQHYEYFVITVLRIVIGRTEGHGEAHIFSDQENITKFRKFQSQRFKEQPSTNLISFTRSHEKTNCDVSHSMTSNMQAMNHIILHYISKGEELRNHHDEGLSTRTT